MIRHTSSIASGLVGGALLVLGGCSSDAPAVLTVGGVGYTEDDLLGLSDARRATLGHLTGFGLAVADSTTAQIGGPWVDERLEEIRFEILAAEQILDDAGVADDVLEARYLTDPQWELVVRHILFFSERWRSDDHRAEAEAKAERAMTALREGADFAATAAELSEEPGAEGRQGLLTPGREGSWVPEFWAAALALEPGEISPVTETQYGYHILRLEGREIVPFPEARSVVARQVADDAGNPRAWLEARLEAADGTDGLRQEVERRGITVPASERAETERAWDDITYRWSATLGFAYGASADQVRAAALAALSDPSQGVDLVRREIDEMGHLVRRVYPPGGTDGSMQP